MNNILNNIKIVVTRAEKQAGPFAKQIKSMGGVPLIFPTISIEAASDFSKTDATLAKIKSYDWLIFTSANSVQFFCLRAQELKVKIQPKNIAVIGQKTADTLRKFGTDIFLVPEVPSARGLLNVFAKLNIKNQKILIPGSDISRQELPEGLLDMGAKVESLIVYENKPNLKLDVNKLRGFIKSGQIDFFTFFSPSSFNAFIDLLGEAVVADIIDKKIALAVIGPTTAQAVKKYNMSIAVESQKSTEEDLLEGIVKYISNSQHGVVINA